MIKLLGKDGLVHNYYGAVASQIQELNEYENLFYKIYVGDYNDSWLIPIANEKEGKFIIANNHDIDDLTHKTAYAFRFIEFYCGDYQNIIDTWYIVGESELSKEYLFEMAKKHQPKGYSRVSIRECKSDEEGCFKITFHKQMKEGEMRKKLKEMGFILKRHKKSCGVNGYMIIKADDNSIYAGENFTMNEADVDKFIHKED